MEMAEDADAQDATSLDSSHIISLLRSFLHACINSDDSTAEEHGSLLWDLSAGTQVASVMVRHGMLLEVLEAVLVQCTGDAAAPAAHSARVAEISLGILGNIAAVEEHAAAIAARPALVAAIMTVLYTQLHAPTLSELCRMCGIALRNRGSDTWLAQWTDEAACAQLLTIMDNTLDPMLHARAIDLVVALLAAEERQARPQVDAHAATDDAQPVMPAHGGVTGMLLQAGLLNSLLAAMQQWLKVRAVNNVLCV